jgi:preprotein translocase subunit Sec61beta
MRKEIKFDPDRMVFFGCMFGGIVLAVVNMVY